MLVGVASLPPSLIPALQNIGILHHKKAKLCIHMRQSVGWWNDYKVAVCLRKIKYASETGVYFLDTANGIFVLLPQFFLERIFQTY